MLLLVIKFNALLACCNAMLACQNSVPGCPCKNRSSLLIIANASLGVIVGGASTSGSSKEGMYSPSASRLCRVTCSIISASVNSCSVMLSSGMSSSCSRVGTSNLAIAVSAKSLRDCCRSSVDCLSSYGTSGTWGSGTGSVLCDRRIEA